MRKGKHNFRKMENTKYKKMNLTLTKRKQIEKESQ
jgi:hypothetical protein